MPRTICAGRQQRIPIGGNEASGTCQVHGFVQLAQINPGMTWTEVAHRWPDGVGGRLDPTSGLLCPSPAEAI
ncbi:hypothetical protein [Methylorubrum extorquens]|jgi:hypothetical protein